MAPDKASSGTELPVVCLHQKCFVSERYQNVLDGAGGLKGFIDENCTVCTSTHDFGFPEKSLTRRLTTEHFYFKQKTLQK